MRDQDRYEEYDDYDDYEDEGGEEYEEGGEEQYQVEEPPKPTKEELEYLEYRKKVKEAIRKKMMKGNNTALADSNARKKKLPYNDFGSFFGPSQPVIAQRVIQESKSLLENPNLATRISNSSHINKNTNKVSNGGSKSSAHSHSHVSKISEKQIKAQKLKDTRDYSFLLSDDAEPPAPKKPPLSHNSSIRKSDGRPAQDAGKSKQPLINVSKHVRGSGDERKLASRAGHLPPKSDSNHKLSSTSKPSRVLADPRKQLGSNSGNGPGRPVVPKVLPSKPPISAVGNKSSTPGMKNPVNGMRRPLPPNRPAPVSKQSWEQRKDPREQNKPKIIPKQPVASSKAQISKPLKQIPKHSDSRDHRPNNKVPRRYSDDLEDEMDVSKMIRSMFNYNPNRFADDDDDDNMEAGFDEIMKEEKRSALIAKREDEEQLRLIEEEEERERRRRAKLKRRV